MKRESNVVFAARGVGNCLRKIVQIICSHNNKKRGYGEHTELGYWLRVPELVAALAGLLHGFGRALAYREELNGFLNLLDPLSRQRVDLREKKKNKRTK